MFLVWHGKRGMGIVHLLILAVLCLNLSMMGRENLHSSAEDADRIDHSEEEAVTSEPIMLTVYSQLSSYRGIQQGWAAKVLKEKFNVILNIIPEEPGYVEYSESLGDIVIWGSTGTQYQQAVEEGLLYDWEQDGLLHEYGPYIEENMAHALQKNRELSGGRLYGLGNNIAASVEDHEAFFYTWDIRWDLYRELDYPEYRDLDELVNVLVRMKEICPVDDNGNETYAVSAWSDWDENMVMYARAIAAAYYGYDEFALGLYNCENGDFYGVLEENGPYLTVLKFLNDLYQKKLLDPDSATQTYSEAAEKVTSGSVFFSPFDYAGSQLYNVSHAEQNKMMISWMPDQAVPLTYGLNIYGGNRVWSIGADTEYPELCMEIINWFCTPEGTMTYYYGPQGVCWDYDEDRHPYFTEFGEKAYFDGSTEMTGDYEGTGAFYDGCFQLNMNSWNIDTINQDTDGDRYNYVYWESYQLPAQSEIEQDWRDFSNALNEQDYLENRSYIVVPYSTYLRSTREAELETSWNLVTEIIVEYSWKAIYAESDEEYDETIAEMLELAQENGYAACIEWSLSEAEYRHQCELELVE